MALAIDVISSLIKTTSAASIATSLPTPPIAIPISLLARTGASLIPSPTKATTWSLPINFSNCVTLSCGNKSLYTWSIPILEAISRATVEWSPVSITVFETCAFFKSWIPGIVDSLITSATTICPKYCFWHAIWTIVPIDWGWLTSIPNSWKYFSFPNSYCFWSITTARPFPAISLKSSILVLSIPLL